MNLAYHWLWNPLYPLIYPWSVHSLACIKTNKFRFDCIHYKHFTNTPIFPLPFDVKIQHPLAKWILDLPLRGALCVWEKSFYKPILNLWGDAFECVNFPAIEIRIRAFILLNVTINFDTSDETSATIQSAHIIFSTEYFLLSVLLSPMNCPFKSGMQKSHSYSLALALQQKDRQ